MQCTVSPFFLSPAEVRDTGQYAKADMDRCRASNDRVGIPVDGQKAPTASDGSVDVCGEVDAYKDQKYSSWFPARWVRREADGRVRLFCGDDQKNQANYVDAISGCLPKNGGAPESTAFVRLYWDPEQSEELQWPRLQCGSYIPSNYPGEPLEACVPATVEALQEGGQEEKEPGSFSFNLAEVIEVRVPLVTSEQQQCTYLMMDSDNLATPWVRASLLQRDAKDASVSLQLGPSRITPIERSAGAPWCQGKQYARFEVQEALVSSTQGNTHLLSAFCSDAAEAPPRDASGTSFWSSLKSFLQDNKMLAAVAIVCMAAILLAIYRGFRSRSKGAAGGGGAADNPSGS